MVNEKIMGAFRYAQMKHDGQLDDEGLNYFDAHILQAYNILENVTDDVDVLCACLLHDTIEDTDTNYKQLEAHFGKRVADIVNEVTHEGAKDNYGFYFPRLQTKEGIMIKFADRLSNISRMGAWDDQRKKQYLNKSKFWKDGSDKK